MDPLQLMLKIMTSVFAFLIRQSSLRNFFKVPSGSLSSGQILIGLSRNRKKGKGTNGGSQSQITREGTSLQGFSLIEQRNKGAELIQSVENQSKWPDWAP